MIDVEMIVKEQNKLDLQKAMADKEKAASYPQRLFSHLLGKLKCTDGERDWLQSQFTEMLEDALEEVMDTSYHNTLKATIEFAKDVLENRKTQEDEENERA